MGDPFVVAIAALGLSLGVSAIRLVDWFMHSDPKVVLRIARLATVGVAVLSIALLLVLMLYQQWTAAIALLAVMVLVLAWYLPRLLQRPFKLLDPAPAQAGEFARRGDVLADRELIERSVVVLEEYLRQAALYTTRTTNLQMISGKPTNGHEHSNGHDRSAETRVMSQDEALEVLGLGRGADEVEISEAHRRLVQLLHPDRGGSHYLTVKINQAKAVLLGAVGDSLESTGAGESRKRTRRRPQRRQHP
jgi:hypothetical protein